MFKHGNWFPVFNLLHVRLPRLRGGHTWRTVGTGHFCKYKFCRAIYKNTNFQRAIFKKSPQMVHARSSQYISLQMNSQLKSKIQNTKSSDTTRSPKMGGISTLSWTGRDLDRDSLTSVRWCSSRSSRNWRRSPWKWSLTEGVGTTTNSSSQWVSSPRPMVCH